MKDVLTAVLLIVLANRDTVGTTRFLHCGGNAREGHHQGAGETIADLIEVGDVPGGYDEHVAPITGLLVEAGKNGGLAVAKCDNVRSQLTTQDPTEHARCWRFHAHRFIPNDTAVQQRTHQGAERPSRPSAWNGQLASTATTLKHASMREPRSFDSEVRRVSKCIAKSRSGKVKRRLPVNASPHRSQTIDYPHLNSLGDDCAQQIAHRLHPERHNSLSADVVSAVVQSRREPFGRHLIAIEDRAA
jgi:hypothetical protein